jgi:hypothetical protein
MYWAARAALSHEGRAPAALELLERDPTGDPAVRGVFAELRVRQDVGLAVAPQARLAKTAVIEGNEIVMRDGVVIAGLDRPLRFAGGVNLPALVEAVSSGSELTSVLNAYRRLAGTGEPAEILAGLAVLAANHILEFRRPDEQESMNRSRTIVADP